ncbi:hypothetical protein [Streptomyces echinatus]|uniref:Uncharacterized protein n=1 Tax=Streptomyces echinatus TaxID=67293 RepID=A0A7W9UUY7_9ACTN|nr:hypothetical protein [Streptomyces echinatus]MBB5932133.1 hypothetical protein [Streptomyces echinatus]
MARARLHLLEGHLGRIALEGSTAVLDAARQLLEDCRRLVDGLDVDAPAGAPEPAPMMSMPFLRPRRTYLDAEANRHLRPAGRSLFGRLSTR